MENTIQSTAYILPLSFIDNGLLGAAWLNPNYFLLRDGLTAQSDPNEGATADVILANFNLNVPSDAIITGVQFKVRGYTGALTVPPASLTFNYVDNSSGENVYYPYTAPFTDFTQDMAEYTFGGQNYLFNHALTVDEINNFKLQLIAAGNLFIDDVQVQAFYYIQGDPTPPTPSDDGICLTCESQIQGVDYFLALNLLSTDTKAYVYNFNYADGTPITISDLGDCGGTIDIVLDEAKIAGNGQNFMENAKIVNITQLANGLVELDFGTLANRGLGFKTPYTHDDDLVSPHSVNAKLIISNNGPFYAKYVKGCQKGIVFSEPIEVDQNSSLIAKPVTKFNFKGPGVSVEQNVSDDEQVDITVSGAGGTTPPLLVDSTSGTSGSTQVITLLTPPSLNVSGLNRGAVVQVITEQLATVVSVTVGGVSCVHKITSTDTPHNLRNEQWVCVNPPLGAQPVVVTLSTPAYLIVGAEALAQIDTSTTVGTVQSNAGTSNNPNLSLTTMYDNSIIIDGLTTGLTPILYTLGAGSALNWSVTANGNARQGASSVQEAGLEPDAVMMDYIMTQTTPWVYTAIEIKGITTNISAGVATVTGNVVDDTDPMNPIVTAVKSVTGLNTDNTDPQNPIVKASVDGTTITGLGTPGSPFVAHAGGASGLVKVDASDTTPDYLTNKISFTSADSTVVITPSITSPGGDEVQNFDLSAPGGGGGGLIAVDGVPTTVGFNTSRSKTLTIPGGILGTGNVIRVTGYGAYSGSATSFEVSYGGVSIIAHPTSTGANNVAHFVLYIFANGATNAQNFVLEIDTTLSSGYTPIGSLTVDSTMNQNVVFTFDSTGAGGNVQIYSLLAELIS